MSQRDAYHHGNLREALVVAATQLIGAHGVEGLTLRAVAREAGVSAAAPYHHFKDKEALVAALCGQGFCLLGDTLGSAIAGIPDPVTRLMTMGRAYVDFASEHTPYFRIMWGRHVEDKAQYPDLQEAGNGAFQLLVQTLMDGQASGDLRAGDPLDFALATWAMVHGMARLVVDKGLENPTMHTMNIDRERMMYVSRDALLRFLLTHEAYERRHVELLAV